MCKVRVALFKKNSAIRIKEKGMPPTVQDGALLCVYNIACHSYSPKGFAVCQSSSPLKKSPKLKKGRPSGGPFFAKMVQGNYTSATNALYRLFRDNGRLQVMCEALFTIICELLKEKELDTNLLFYIQSPLEWPTSHLYSSAVN